MMPLQASRGSSEISVSQLLPPFASALKTAYVEPGSSATAAPSLETQQAICDISSHEARKARLSRRKRGVVTVDERAMSSQLMNQSRATHAQYDLHDHRSEECFKELLRVAEAHLLSQQTHLASQTPGNAAEPKRAKRLRTSEGLQSCKDSHCSPSSCDANRTPGDCNVDSCVSREESARLTAKKRMPICPVISNCCNDDQSLPKVSPDVPVIVCQDTGCVPTISCEDARCLSQEVETRKGTVKEICTESCDLGLHSCSTETTRMEAPCSAVNVTSCPSCEEYQPNVSTFQEMLDCWCCSDYEAEQCCPTDIGYCSNTLAACNDCCFIEEAAPILFTDEDLHSNDSRSRTTSISMSYLGSPGASSRSYASASSISNTGSHDIMFKQEYTLDRSTLHCTFEAAHKHNEAGVCIPPSLTRYDHTDKSDSNSMYGMEPLICHWAGCGMQCCSIADLSNHVNNVHLSLPVPSTGNTSAAALASNGWADQSTYLKCLWDSCQMEQVTADPTSMQSWDDSQIILKHILQAHVGIEEVDSNMPPPMNRDMGKSKEVSMSSCTSRENSLFAISEQDDEFHRCAWQDCTLCFDSHEALTEHITRDHVGSGKGQYECLWRGCSRGQRVFHQKQKMLRHLQTHTHHRPFVCEVCQKKFSEANTLSQHRRTHTNERPYLCDFPGCGKSFAVAGSLTIHKRIHSGEKPFKCTWPGCTKAFAESSNLAKHHRIHSGARPFHCDIDGCQLSFSRSDQLARHKRTHEKGQDKKGAR